MLNGRDIMTEHEFQKLLDRAYLDVLEEANLSHTPISFIKNGKLMRKYPNGKYFEVIMNDTQWIEVECLEQN